MTTSLHDTLRHAGASGASAFVPFIVAGDPGLDATVDIALALQAAGAGALELGVPFSDPVADGETIQRASERALAAGTTLKRVIASVKTMREKGLTMPVCLFSYLNPVYAMGYDAFIRAAQDSGIQGALIVDLPPEEAADYCAAAQKQNFETVFLCSPTTSPARLKMIDAASTGFVYYVARAGVTGVQNDMADDLVTRLQQVRAGLKNPLAVGFGISAPAHLRALSGHADAIVVGSHIVKTIAAHPQNAAAATAETARHLLGA